jgi:hypothetical protein
MRIYCGNWKRRIRGPEGGWIVRFRERRVKRETKINLKKLARFSQPEKRRSTHHNSPTISPAKNHVLHPVFSQNPLQKGDSVTPNN